MFIIFDLPSQAENLAKFNAWNTLAAQFFNYPDPTTGTEKYSDPIFHPDSIQVAMPILQSTLDNVNADPQNRANIVAMLGEPQIVEKLPQNWIPEVPIQ